MALFGIVSLFYMILILGLVGIGIYGFILFVKLANRGIKALDIYINKIRTSNKGSFCINLINMQYNW